jgi:putative spermidine/putrescine transport system ATP-binding protein
MTATRQGAGLRIDGVAKRYGEVVALRPTSLAIEAGEFFTLLGPSGSGKSTLLAAIAGFVPPSEGRVVIDAVDVTGLPPYARNIGMVFQNYTLFPHMTVFDNIAFPLRMRKRPRAEIAERVTRMLAMVRLPGFEARSPAQLSGGQQQRVALARAAVYDPPLLLMDEPLGALDRNLREEMQDEIKQFHRQLGSTVVYVTHDQAEAAALSDRVAILNHGVIEQAGRPRELYEAPRNAFVASFLGEANLFVVTDLRAHGEGERVVETREGLLLRVESPAVAAGGLVACIRPERLRIGSEKGESANVFPGVVTDVVHGGGSVRYRVRVADRCTLTVRMVADRRADDYEVGRGVYVWWDPADTVLIPVE